MCRRNSNKIGWDSYNIMEAYVEQVLQTSNCAMKSYCGQHRPLTVNGIWGEDGTTTPCQRTLAEKTTKAVKDFLQVFLEY